MTKKSNQSLTKSAPSMDPRSRNKPQINALANRCSLTHSCSAKKLAASKIALTLLLKHKSWVLRVIS
jgi:hypothetical protein